jgi:RNA polymerase sigma-70 factor (ECF subfamily)
MEQPESGTSAKKADISDLFRKIEKGEKDALFDLYDRTGGLLFGLTLKILGNVSDAEETLLNIYTRIWKDPVSCDAGYPPLAWLVMIARAHALTRLYETRRSYAPEQTAANNADKKTVTNKEQEDARACFKALAPKQREILNWAFCSGLTAEGIADKTGSTVGAVKTHVRIGLNRLGKTPAFSETNFVMDESKEVAP